MIIRTQIGPFGVLLRLPALDAAVNPSPVIVAAHVVLTYRALSRSPRAEPFGLPSLAPVHDLFRQHLLDLANAEMPTDQGATIAGYLFADFERWSPDALMQWGGTYGLERVELGIVEAVGPAAAPGKTADALRGSQGHEAGVTWYTCEIERVAIRMLETGMVPEAAAQRAARAATVAPLPTLQFSLPPDAPGDLRVPTAEMREAAIAAAQETGEAPTGGPVLTVPDAPSPAPDA